MAQERRGVQPATDAEPADAPRPPGAGPAGDAPPASAGTEDAQRADATGLGLGRSDDRHGLGPPVSSPYEPLSGTSRFEQSNPGYSPAMEAASPTTPPGALADDRAGLNVGGLSRLLLDGERVDSTLNLEEVARQSELEAVSDDVVLLTDQRLIQLSSGARRSTTTFVSLGDIDAVEIARERQGFGGYVWGGLAILAALLLLLIWDQPVGSVVGAIVVVLMGVYLIVDQVLTPGRAVANFRVGGSILQCVIAGEVGQKEVHGFVNRLFQLKGEAAD